MKDHLVIVWRKDFPGKLEDVLYEKARSGWSFVSGFNAVDPDFAYLVFEKEVPDILENSM